MMYSVCTPHRNPILHITGLYRENAIAIESEARDSRV